MPATLLLTGFERFGAHAINPTEPLVLGLDGHVLGGWRVRAAVLPVHRVDGPARVLALLDDVRPAAVLHLGLAEGRARIALEQVAVNLLDYPIPDNAGHRAAGEPCVPGGPAAYLSTLPLAAMQGSLTAAGIPAYLSTTAGTYLCNQVLYTTLHVVRYLDRAVATRRLAMRAGFAHVPLLPAMVAAAGAEAPSMDLALMRRAVEVLMGALVEAGR